MWKETKTSAQKKKTENIYSKANQEHCGPCVTMNRFKFKYKDIGIHFSEC